MSDYSSSCLRIVKCSLFSLLLLGALLSIFVQDITMADTTTSSSETYPYPTINLTIDHDSVRILCIDISPGDEYAAIGLANGSVIIYNISTKYMVTVLHPGHWVWDVEWCPVGSTPVLAVATGKNWDNVEGWFKIYSGPSWALVEERTYGSQIFSISWKSDGSLLAVPNINIVDLIWTGNWTRMGAVLPGNNYKMAVEWQPEGGLLAVGQMSFGSEDYEGSVDILDSSDDYSVHSHMGGYSFSPDVLRWDQQGSRLGIGNLSLEVWDVDKDTPVFTRNNSEEIWINGWGWANGGDGFFVANNSRVEFIDPNEPRNDMHIDLSDYVLGISLTSDNSVLMAIAFDTLYFIDITWIEPPDVEADIDGDGVTDEYDAFPTDPAASIDTDGDGFPDIWNPGKSADDSTTGLKLDLYPLDPSEWADGDGDGIPDNTDRFPDDIAASEDLDGDGYPDRWNMGMNEENSTTGLKLDEFPTDPLEWIDTDGDGHGDNSDEFPEDPNEWADSDGDGIPDNTDRFPDDIAASEDLDGDGYPDRWNTGMNEGNSTTGLRLDDFPTDPLEWIDTDGDGHGDNSDRFPEDPNEWADTDEDGVGNEADAFPTDPAASVDTDGDGYPDSWNPGMRAEDSTTGLVLDRYPLDPKNRPDGDGVNDTLTSPWVYVPIIVFILSVIAILATLIMVRWRRSSNMDTDPDEYRISKYRDGVLKGLDDDEYDIPEGELLEDLSRKRYSGEISEETFTFIIENVVGGK
ncbi:MAG: hypothetical protein JXA22_08065 [Candidatus Thermoplasmatota archaeon]|nr:hypothetical protein [Candidatus Thermoplasmatota archaeon]